MTTPTNKIRVHKSQIPFGIIPNDSDPSIVKLGKTLNNVVLLIEKEGYKSWMEEKFKIFCPDLYEKMLVLEEKINEEFLNNRGNFHFNSTAMNDIARALWGDFVERTISPYLIVWLEMIKQVKDLKK